MRRLFFIFTNATAIILVFLVHIFITSWLPYPFNRVNFIFIALFWLVLWHGTVPYVWGVALAFFYELFAAAPFGVGAVSLIAGLIFADWFLHRVLTNRSALTLFITILLTLMLNKLVFILILTFYGFMKRISFFPNSGVLIGHLWEIGLSSALFALVYLTTARYLKRLNPAYVRASRTRL